MKFEVCLLQYIRSYFLLNIIGRLLLQLSGGYTSVDSLVWLCRSLLYGLTLRSVQP